MFDNAEHARDWLREGFLWIEFGVEPTTGVGFAGAEPELARYDLAELAISKFFVRLDLANKEKFKSGLDLATQELLLKTLEDRILSRRFVGVASAIEYFQPLLSVSMQLGRVLASLEDDSQFVRDTTRNIVYSLDSLRPVNNPVVEEVVRALLFSKEFSPVLARNCLSVLTATRPSGLPEFLELLHPHLQERYESQICISDPNRKNERRRRILGVLDTVKHLPRVIAESYELSPHDWDRNAARGWWRDAYVYDNEISRVVNDYVRGFDQRTDAFERSQALDSLFGLSFEDVSIWRIGSVLDYAGEEEEIERVIELLGDAA